MESYTSDPESTLLCLVRHGETDWNVSGQLQGQSDIPLNLTGRLQADLTGAYLKQWTWDALISSPLSRASDSARIIAEHLGLTPVELRDDLVEAGFGLAEGLTAAESALRWPDGGIPGRETVDEVRARASRIIDAITTEHARQRVLVVSHGALINAMLSVLSNGEIGSGKTRLANACISLVTYRDGIWRIDAYSSTAHLETAADAPPPVGEQF